MGVGEKRSKKSKTQTRESVKDRRMRKALERKCQLQVRPSTVVSGEQRATKSGTTSMKFVPFTTMQIRAYEFPLAKEGQNTMTNLSSGETANFEEKLRKTAEKEYL